MRSREILKLANNYHIKYHNWRWGQCIFNAAYELYPIEADRLRATSIDCFHKDELVEEFLNQIDKL